MSFLEESLAGRISPASLVELALEVLDRVGVLVEDPEAADLLRGGGVLAREGRLFLPPDEVLAALGTVPPTVSLHDRDGNHAATIGAGRTLFAPGSAALRVLDPGTGRQRPAMVRDLVALARLTGTLRSCSLQSTGLVPSDVDGAMADKARLLVALTHGIRPVITGTFREDSFDVMKGMLVAMRRDEADFRSRPLAIFDCCPTPPLTWGRLACRSLIACARSGIPAQIVSMPIGGGTAPVTLRERLIQHVAENLAGVMLHQRASAGSPVIFGGAAATCDMRHGTTPTAGIESMLMGRGIAGVGRHLGIPTQFFLGLTDSPILDWQAGMEAGIGLTMATLGGVGLVTGLGMMDTIGCLSLEKLWLDDVIAQMLGFAAGPSEMIEGSATLPLLLDLVRTGQMLGHPHTRRHFRTALHPPGPAVSRLSFAGWEAGGRVDSAGRAREEVARILAGHPDGELAPERRRELLDIIAAEARRLGVPFDEGPLCGAGDSR